MGINLFDSGHNHGGGDAALLDAGTRAPRVLHGICGEDYFAFAWHRTGAMIPLTGAPAHERRYRLHLENPYPFHESIRFLFELSPVSIPKASPSGTRRRKTAENNPWETVDVPWKVLGPLGLDTSLPEMVTSEVHKTVVPIKEPTRLEEHWQDGEMRAGFLDATYQFRHYTMTESGTGFVAGRSQTRMRTYLCSPSARSLRAILGHDDRVLVRLNDLKLADIAAGAGFAPFPVTLALRSGWNRLDLLVFNDENLNWRLVWDFGGA